MFSKYLRRLFLLFGSVLLCTGFNVYPGNKGWRIDSATTAGRKVFITLSSSGKTLSNDMPASDSLAASPSTLTELQALNSIISDFNSIRNSNLIFAMDSDSDFAANKTDRRIFIEFGSAAGLSSGEARTTTSNNYITECKISLTDKAYTSALAYVRLVTHELGHCVGLDHPQETVWSVMSYFYNDSVIRLAADDKMGLVYLYGTNSDYRREKPTLGMSCSAR